MSVDDLVITIIKGQKIKEKLHNRVGELVYV